MRICPPAVLGLTLVACLAHGEEKWHEASSENFLLVTNASPERAESILLTLERFRAALGQVLPELRRWTSSRTRVYGFRDYDSLEPFLPPSEPRDSRVAGDFRKGTSQGAIDLHATGRPPGRPRREQRLSPPSAPGPAPGTPSHADRRAPFDRRCGRFRRSLPRPVLGAGSLSFRRRSRGPGAPGPFSRAPRERSRAGHGLSRRLPLGVGRNGEGGRRNSE